MNTRCIPIDWKIVDDLLECGCLGTEVASLFGMHPDTFYIKVKEKFGVGFSEYSAKKKATGEAVLRKAQYDKAIGRCKKGDNTLLIWLGKQRLDQREHAIENAMPEDMVKPFVALMNQIAELQVARNIADKSNISEQKSA